MVVRRLSISTVNLVEIELLWLFRTKEVQRLFSKKKEEIISVLEQRVFLRLTRSVNQQADLKNHGGEHKAVYAFSSDHYPYWSKVLQNSELKPGIFGENLTISGFDESALHIGDQLSIGQCILEVAQPRIPCFKLGIAVGNTNMPRLFIENFATGAYLRVIQEGLIEAENTVKIIKEGQFNLSVQSVFRSYFDKEYTESVSIMEKALLLPELSPEWRKKFPLGCQQSKQKNKRLFFKLVLIKQKISY